MATSAATSRIQPLTPKKKKKMEWCLDENDKLVIRITTPRVVIDNAASPTATLVKVDSGTEHRILLEAIQVLADLDLSIRKAYISSDGRWLMDVFHVTDILGRKISDDAAAVSSIEQSLAVITGDAEPPGDKGGAVIELAGGDRPGLLSEVFAVLEDLRCRIGDAKVWTNNGRMAALISVAGAGEEDEDDDIWTHTTRLIEYRLRNVLGGERAAVVSPATVHAERRLHQMMFEDRDFDISGAGTSPEVTVHNWAERGYSVVNVQCRDRPKLVFDTLCTLTDMDYIVFHGTIDTDDDGDRARQEFYIRHKDGTPIGSEAERQRVIICLQAAIRRRTSEGLRLEIRAEECRRQGMMLADVTRTLRESGLTVAMADVSARLGTAEFYVTDAAGNRAGSEVVDAVRRRVGGAGGVIAVVGEEGKVSRGCRKAAAAGGGGSGGLLGLMKRNLYNLGIFWSLS